ncbi:MAG: hypothetical protein DMF86_08475 [Acidobacteria bacterium]|nr:MAG: hypothetical protein DMF86_08475 [Acidobacteriota bacterium]
MLTSTSRAFAELLCASTNSARSLIFGELFPSSVFCTIGTAVSGSLFISALSANSFSSSSLSL